mmetsp:Transcript_7075/g.13958  ORF Transcript_7075/g.13958 Transcript_7075/m.13958 type:complete len:87 (+) Transcript_7075:384-644(+)
MGGNEDKAFGNRAFISGAHSRETRSLVACQGDKGGGGRRRRRRRRGREKEKKSWLKPPTPSPSTSCSPPTRSSSETEPAIRLTAPS